MSATSLTPKRKAPTKRRRGRPIDVKARERQHQAVQLRIEGLTFQQIADRLGYASTGSVVNAVQAALSRQEAETNEVYRDLHRARLTRLLQGIWPIASSGMDTKAIDSALRILDSLAKLDGLNRPASLEVSGPDGGPITSQVNVIAWTPDQEWLQQFAQAWSEVTDADVKHVGPGSASP